MDNLDVDAQRTLRAVPQQGGTSIIGGLAELESELLLPWRRTLARGAGTGVKLVCIFLLNWGANHLRYALSQKAMAPE